MKKTLFGIWLKCTLSLSWKASLYTYNHKGLRHKPNSKYLCQKTQHQTFHATEFKCFFRERIRCKRNSAIEREKKLDEVRYRMTHSNIIWSGKWLFRVCVCAIVSYISYHVTKSLQNTSTVCLVFVANFCWTSHFI